MNIQVLKAVWRRIRRPSQKTLKGLPVVQPQPQWNYKARSKKHGILMPLLLLVAATAWGAIGETVDQFESGKPTSITVNGNLFEATWAGKTITHVGAFERGRCEIEVIYYTDHRAMTFSDFAKFLKPYESYPQEVGTNERGMIVNIYQRSGMPYAMGFYSFEDHTLSVLSAKAGAEIEAEVERQEANPQVKL
jgi:hypothetical protein